MHPKTITTCLITGDPLGMKTVEILGRVGKCIVIPRSQLQQAKDRNEVSKPAIYFLFGEDNIGNQLCYIGKTATLFQRILSHDSKKEFWNIIIAFISRDDTFDINYLEERAIKLAHEAKKYKSENIVSPNPIIISESQKAPMDEFLRNIDLVLSSTGYPIFQKSQSTSHLNSGENIYTYKDNNIKRGACTDAKGIYSNDGFIILKGSIGPSTLQDHVIKNRGYARRHRPRLLELGVIKEEGDAIIFQIDYLFGSPSSALSILTGASVNGWEYRKDEQGKTMRENEIKLLDKQ